MDSIQKEAIKELLGIEYVALPKKKETHPIPEQAVEQPPNQDQEKVWQELLVKALSCQDCNLCQERNNVVFGEGNIQAELMFIGEAPGRDEDKQGVPFVGRAGQLLTKMITAMGLNRQQVYIANIIKCRPPQNRNPKPEEIEACQKYLIQQVELVQPKVVCALGTFAAQWALQREDPISKLRGKEYPMAMFPKVTCIPTYHPAYLLRNPKAKVQCWEDLKNVLTQLGYEVPA